MAATKQKKGHNAGPLAVSNTANVIICIILGLFCLSCVLPVLLVYTTSFTDELAITKNGVSLFPGQRRAALLIFHRSRQVTLGDVGDFVRHY